MQKVVGSSPIIRSTKAPLDRVFCCLRVERRDWKWLASASLCLNMEPRRVSASVAFAYLCPSEGAVVGFPVRGAEAVAAFGGLRVNLQGEAWVFVSELVGGVADVVAASAAQACVRAAERVEGDVADGRDAELLEFVIRSFDGGREYVWVPTTRFQRCRVGGRRIVG